MYKGKAVSTALRVFLVKKKNVKTGIKIADNSYESFVTV